MPPDVLFLETQVSIVWIQDEPEEVPVRADEEVCGHGQKFVRKRPFQTHRELSMEDKQGQEEHERVVASERFATQQKSVDTRREPCLAIPGRSFISPAVLSFGFNFDRGHDKGQAVPEKDLDDESLHGLTSNGF